MATKFISFANNQRFLRVTNSRTNTISYISKLNLVIEKDNHESFYLKNDDFIKYYNYKDVLYPSSRDMGNLVTKLVDICQGDALTENLLLDDIKRSPLVSELKVSDVDTYEKRFCTKREALVYDGTNATYVDEKMRYEFDGITELTVFRNDIHGRTRNSLPDYTSGSLVGFKLGYGTPEEQVYELKLCASDGIRFATSAYPKLKRRIVQQSKEYTSIPVGKTRVALMSAAMLRTDQINEMTYMGSYTYAAEVTGTSPAIAKKVVYKSRVGMFDNGEDVTVANTARDYMQSNGIYFEYTREFRADDGGQTATDMEVFDRDTTSPDIVNNLKLVLMINGDKIEIDQSNFNIDRINATGPSGVSFDPNRITTFMFKFGTINDTVITAGIFNEGNMIMVHTFTEENLKNFNYSAKVPMRWEFEMEHSIQGGTSVDVLDVDGYVMLRGSGAVYANESLELFNETKTSVVPVKKNFKDTTPHLDLSMDPHPDPDRLVYHSINPSIRVFKIFTPQFNKDIMFGIRLNRDFRRNKVQLQNVVLQSNDSAQKTVIWKLVRNAKYRRLMWRLNVPELRQNRSLKLVYTNAVNEQAFYTPNDIHMHQARPAPVLMYDKQYADDQTGLESTDASFETNREMMVCEFDGSYTKKINGGPAVRKYVDLKDVEDPANGSFDYQYLSEIEKTVVFENLKVSMCELWSVESGMKNLDASDRETNFQMIPNEGSFKDTDDGGMYISYDGTSQGVSRNYSTPIPSRYIAYEMYDVEETYDYKPNIEASGVIQFSTFHTIDLSTTTPLFSDIAGKSDEYVFQVEFGPNSVAEVNLQTTVNWMEYK